MEINSLLSGTEEQCDNHAGATEMDSYGRFCPKPADAPFETLMTPTITIEEMAHGGRILKMFKGGALPKDKQVEQNTELKEAIEELSEIVNEEKPKLDTPLAFEFMKYLASKTGETSKFVDKFFKEKELKLLPEAKEAIIREAFLMQNEIVQLGGIIRDKKVLDYNKYTDYRDDIKERIASGRTAEQDKWIGNHIARKIFVERKPQTKEEIELCDKIEDAISVIEEYYKGFTEKGVQSAMIQIKERNYGGDKRIGIVIKAEPYAHQFTIRVNGIIGGYDIEISDRGTTLELDEDAKIYGLSKTYDHLPDIEDLIDDFCVIDLLASMPSKGIIQRDSTQSLVYPTTKDAFETGYQTVGGGQYGKEVLPISEMEAVRLYKDGAVAEAMKNKTEANKKLSPSQKNNVSSDNQNSIKVEVKQKEQVAEEQEDLTTKDGIIKSIINKLPVVDGMSDGRIVRDEVPNFSSIEASLSNHIILDGIRDVSLSFFVNKVNYYSKSEEERTKKLANEIKKSNEITPLIVTYEANGPYILEGAHRFDALIELGAKSFPAKVAIDIESFFKDSKEEPKVEEAQPMIVFEEDESQRETYFEELNKFKNEYLDKFERKYSPSRLPNELAPIIQEIEIIIAKYPSFLIDIIKWDASLPAKKKINAVRFMEGTIVREWLSVNKINPAALIDLGRFNLPVAEGFETNSADTYFMDIHAKFVLTKKKDDFFDQRYHMTMMNFDSKGVASTDGYELLFTKYRGKNAERGMYAYIPEVYENVKTANWRKKKVTDEEIKSVGDDISKAIKKYITKPGFVDDKKIKNFPDYKSVIPHTYERVIPINTYALYNFLQNMISANFYSEKNHLIELRHGVSLESIYFNAKLLLNGLLGMIELGHSDLQFCFSGANRALLITERGVTGEQVKELKTDIVLVMPIIEGEELNASGISFDIDNGCAYYPNAAPHHFTNTSVVPFEWPKKVEVVEEKVVEEIIPVTEEKRRNFAFVVAKILASSGVSVSDKRKILALINPKSA